MENIKNSLLLSLWLISLVEINAQETRFFIPKEIAQAYENHTRSFDGKPGSRYWQNTVDYTIEVEVLPDDLMISGRESVIYFNESPDDLHELIIRLYHDVFRKANPRSSRVRSSDITDGVKINHLVIDGDTLDLAQETIRRGTNMIIQLPDGLASGDKVNLDIGWSQKIPETTRRTGAYDSTSFFLAYWYPQVAVYDDIFGWDRLAYDFSTEFYNNLANYDVTIRAPEQFTVLATGELQNPEEVMTSAMLERYHEAKRSTETITVIGPEDLRAGIAHKNGSWHYVARDVPDFAFCLSDHFCWDAATQKVEDRDVFIHSYYQVSLAAEAKEVTTNQQKMMKHFSLDAPGVAYPYPEFTTFISGAGGGGMEYPMMANNGGPGLGVTVHEMFHTYFPMYVRINEKRFAWMDEGWADFITSWVITRHFQEDDSTHLFENFSFIGSNLGGMSDLPLITSTQFMDFSNYGYASYTLPAFIYSLLHQHLGEELFLNCLGEYIRRWAHKSPTPYDFMYTFENVSGQDLSWFWNPWFFNFGSIDVLIESYKKGKLVLRNKGNRPVPIVVNTEYSDGSNTQIVLSAQSWQDDNLVKIKIPRKKEIKTISVNDVMPDENILDNYQPSLQDRYGDFEITSALLGTYQLNEFPVSAIITEKDEILHFDMPGAGLSTYLIPDKEGQFKSTNGLLTIEFEKEGNGLIGLTLKLFNITATAKKISSGGT